ncbi:MAG: chemotaxis protein CheW [Chloroflexi bacterium]|nr:chemotaxis protein CheW [Chloroflexota bacterium]
MAECQLLLVEVAGERLAVRSSQVVEVRVFDPRSQATRPVLDLAEALGLARQSAGPGYELVTRVPRGIACWSIDQAQDMLAVPEEALLPLPPLARGPAAERGIRAAVVLEGRVVLVLDPGEMRLEVSAESTVDSPRSTGR